MNGQPRGMWMWLAAASLAGCAPSLSSLSAGEVGCPPSQVEISHVQSRMRSKSWVAACGGRSFQCSGNRTGNAASPLTVSCAPLGGAVTSGGERSAKPPSNARSSDVERDYDEAQDIHGVKGTFGLPAGSTLVLSAAPAAEPGIVRVRYEGPSTKLNSCETLEVLVNDVPHAAREVELSSRLGGRVRSVEGVTDAAWYAPLTGKYPQLAIRNCGGEVRLDDTQIPALQKFLGIHAELVAPTPDHKAVETTDDAGDSEAKLASEPPATLSSDP